jgi:hypothetical protein
MCHHTLGWSVVDPCHVPVVSLANIIIAYILVPPQYLIGIGDSNYLDWSPYSIGWISCQLPPRPTGIIRSIAPLHRPLPLQQSSLMRRASISVDEKVSSSSTRSFVISDRPGYRRIFGTFPPSFKRLEGIAVIGDRLFVHGFNDPSCRRGRTLISLAIHDIINQTFGSDVIPISSIESASSILKWKCDHSRIPTIFDDCDLIATVWRHRLVFINGGPLSCSSCYYG